MHEGDFRGHTTKHLMNKIHQIKQRKRKTKKNNVSFSNNFLNFGFCNMYIFLSSDKMLKFLL
jgi:hypothetical protein